MDKLNSANIDLIKSIVSKLDEKDGKKNNKIEASVWNEFVADKGGKTIQNCIWADKAEKSVRYYLNKCTSNTDECSELVAKWLNNILEDDNKNNKKTMNVAKASEGSSLKQVSLTENNFENPDSVCNAEFIMEKVLQLAENKKDLSGYETIPKISSSSFVKTEEMPIDEEIMDKAFDNVIAELMRRGNKKRSALTGTAKEFLKSANERKLNPFILMGISMIESSYGTSKMALTKNNVGGLTPNGRDGIHCQTVSDSINIAANTLHKNVYGKNLNNIESVGMYGNYCCASDDIRRNWVSNVIWFANEVRKEYNNLLLQEKLS